MAEFVFDPGAWPSLPVTGSDRRFAVRRVYCVGRNYSEHVREMGHDPDREQPFFFQKPADAIVPGGGAIAYPPLTNDFQYEVEYVLAIGREGVDVSAADAHLHVFGVGLGIDFTRRDRQLEAREGRRPWEVGKAFDQSAPCSAITPLHGGALPKAGRIMLSVNGTPRQQGDLRQMIWNADEVVAKLSQGYRIMPGDLIFTGTPAGVGAVVRGDRIDCELEGIATLSVVIAR